MIGFSIPKMMLTLAALAIVFVSHGQSITDSTKTSLDFFKDPHLTLYDYSKMKDTVIREVGALHFRSDGFQKGKGPAFSEREITVKNGRLKKVFIMDTNTGTTTTYLYNRKGLFRIKWGRCQATNNAHFY